jgi:hypothetical protein
MRWCGAGNGYARHAARRRRGDPFAGGSDGTDVAPTAGGDLVAELPEAVVGADALDGFHRGPATRVLPCLVIRPRWTVVSDSWCLGVSPAQLASWAGPGKR